MTERVTPKVGDWVRVSTGIGNYRFGEITKVYTSGKSCNVRIGNLETYEFLVKDILELRPPQPKEPA